MSFSCRLFYSGVAVIISAERLLSKACTLLESAGECTLSLKTYITAGHQPHGQLAALTMRPLIDFLGGQYILFVFSLIDDLAISDCWVLIFILCAYSVVWVPLRLPHPKFLPNFPFSYNKNISSQNTCDCLLVHGMPCLIGSHACSLTFKTTLRGRKNFLLAY